MERLVANAGAGEEGSDRVYVDEKPTIHLKDSPTDILVKIIKEQKKKEDIISIWKESKFKKLPFLQSNNVGAVGESLLKEYCKKNDIDEDIDGLKTKGGCGDGTIKGKSVEIKTAHMGSKNKTFQHELGENPWVTDCMIFIDVSPDCIFLTIFENYSEERYKRIDKCEPLFPTKSICWRKSERIEGTNRRENGGAFKLDTSFKINEDNCRKEYTIRINDDTNFKDIGDYINLIIK